MKTKLKQAIAYTRVSTEGQEKHGVGLDLQLVRIREFARHAGYEIVRMFSDAETGKGEDTIRNRSGIRDAITLPREEKLPILVDGWSRVARNVNALEKVVKEGRLTVISCSPAENGSHAAIMGDVARAQREVEIISERTRAALQELKRNGVRLGNPTNLDEAQIKGAAANRQQADERAGELVPIVRELRAGGRTTARAIAEGLNTRGLRTPRNEEWNAGNVRRLLDRIAEHEQARNREEDLRNPDWGTW